MGHRTPNEFISNWRSSDLSTTGKVRAALRNNWIKLMRRSGCCGNHGEPGC